MTEYGFHVALHDTGRGPRLGALCTPCEHVLALAHRRRSFAIVRCFRDARSPRWPCSRGACSGIPAFGAFMTRCLQGPSGPSLWMVLPHRGSRGKAARNIHTCCRPPFSFDRGLRIECLERGIGAAARRSLNHRLRRWRCIRVALRHGFGSWHHLSALRRLIFRRHPQFEFLLGGIAFGGAAFERYRC